ncbi:hypothetical protein YC2023_004429 [Brassica napus]
MLKENSNSSEFPAEIRQVYRGISRLARQVKGVMESRTFELEGSVSRTTPPRTGPGRSGKEGRTQGRGVRNFTEGLNPAKKWTSGIQISQ